MPELGKILSNARVDRGLTLEDCERDTRISKRYLDALEREDWKIFPAPVYSRAFLRTYAQYLNLDPAELMRQFQALTAEPEVQPLPEVKQPDASGSVNWLLAGAVVVFLAVAGAFLYFSGGNDGGETVVAPPPTPLEGQGGGPPTGVDIDPVIEEGVVPDVRGVSVADAVERLSEAGIPYLIVETNVDGDPGVVVSQDPEPNTNAGSDTAVTLVVPRG
jgi:transcriptional regulator with XRE-family HTH domain